MRPQVSHLILAGLIFGAYEPMVNATIEGQISSQNYAYSSFHENRLILWGGSEPMESALADFF